MKKRTNLIAANLIIVMILGSCRVMQEPESNLLPSETCCVSIDISDETTVDTVVTQNNTTVSSDISPEITITEETYVSNTTDEIPYVDTLGNRYNDCTEYENLYETILENNIFESHLLTRCDNRVVSYYGQDYCTTYDFMGNELSLNDVFTDFDLFCEFAEPTLENWYNETLHDSEREASTIEGYKNAFKNTENWYFDANSIVFVLTFTSNPQKIFFHISYNECMDYIRAQYLPSEGMFVGIYTCGDIIVSGRKVTTSCNFLSYRNDLYSVTYDNQNITEIIDVANEGQEGCSFVGNYLYFIRNADNCEVFFATLVNESEGTMNSIGAAAVVFDFTEDSLAIRTVEYNNNSLSETIGID